MRPNDAYGNAPDRFKASISSVLQQLEEEKPVKVLNTRLAICIALTLLLLAGVVYAAVNDWKLFDFYTRRFGVEVQQGAQDAFKQNELGQRIEVGGVLFTVQEMVADGRYLYLSAKAAPTTENSAYLMGMGESPTDWIAIDGNYDAANRRSYQTAAREERKRLISAEISVSVAGHEDGSGMGDSVMHADGSLSIILVLELPLSTEEKAIDVELTSYVLEWLLSEGDEEFAASEVQKESIRFVLPVTPPIAQLSIELGGQPLPGTAALFERCLFLVTPLSCYYKIEYTVVDLEDKLLTAHSRNVLWLELLDEQGELLPRGLSMSISRYSEDDVHFVYEGSLQLEALPKTITIRPDESWGAEPEDVLVLNIPTH